MKIRLFCLFLLACLFLSGCGAVNSESQDTVVQLLCLNIGKADCMLLMYGDYVYLIDTGYEQNWPALKTALAQHGISRLNGVFLTHCHEDHEGGLMLLSKSDIQVDAWYASKIFYDQKENKHPAVLAAAYRSEAVTWLEAGASIPVGSDARFTVLGPLTVNTDNENNNSLVMRFDSHQGSILLAGDMKEDEEFELLDANCLTPCDLLKVGHHGDNKATGKAFLSAIQPKAAIILTSSEEEPDTPAESTIKRLDKIGCRTYVSQEFHDAVLFTISGGKVSAEDIVWQGVPERAEGIRIQINVAQDTLTISNQSASPLSLSGCALYSSRGNELLYLPDVTVQPGEKYVIGSGETTAKIDLTWRKKRVWHQNSRDVGILYDTYGRPLAVTDNGITE